jgi:hypothetical protein
VQSHGEYFGALPIVIRVALMARHVSIIQRMKRHADVCRIFVVCSIVAAVTGAAAFFARMDGVPFALLTYGMRLGMARAARRFRVLTLRDGSLWLKQHDQPDCQHAERRNQPDRGHFVRRHVNLLAGDSRLL